MNLVTAEDQEELPANSTESEQTLDPVPRRWAIRKFGFVAVAAVAKLLTDAQPASAALPSPGGVCDLRGEYIVTMNPRGSAITPARQLIHTKNGRIPALRDRGGWGLVGIPV